MKKFFLQILLLVLICVSCGRQVPEGTSIKIETKCDCYGDEIQDYKSKLTEKLKKFNFVVKSGGDTDYTIVIEKFSKSGSSNTVTPSDDCSYGTYTLNSESIKMTASLFQYTATNLETWYFSYYDKDKLKKKENGSCYDYSVERPFWQLFQSEIDAFARRTARRSSRIVFKQ